jgi:hypothetical protein
VRPSLEQIQQVVCGAFGVTANDLTAARSHGNDARVAAIYLGRDVGALQVGRLARANTKTCDPSLIGLLRSIDSGTTLRTPRCCALCTIRRPPSVDRPAPARVRVFPVVMQTAQFATGAEITQRGF